MSSTWSVNDVIAFFEQYPFITSDQRQLLQIKQYTPVQLRQSLIKVLNELKIQEKDARDQIILDWNQISLKQLTPTYVLQRKPILRSSFSAKDPSPSSSDWKPEPALSSTPSNAISEKVQYFPSGEKKKPVVQFEDDISSEDTRNERKAFVPPELNKEKAETKWNGKEEYLIRDKKTQIVEKDSRVTEGETEKRKPVEPANANKSENDDIEKAIDDIYFYEIDELSVEEEKERKEIEDIRRKLSISQSVSGLSGPHSKSNSSITPYLQRNDDIITPSRRPSSFFSQPLASTKQPPNDLIETISQLQQVIEVLNNEKFALQDKNEALSHELTEKSKVLNLTIQEMKSMEQENHAILEESQKLTENLIQLREKYDKLVAVAKRTTLLINPRQTNANKSLHKFQQSRKALADSAMEKLVENENDNNDNNEEKVKDESVRVETILSEEEEEDLMMSMLPENFETVAKVEIESQTDLSALPTKDYQVSRKVQTSEKSMQTDEIAIRDTSIQTSEGSTQTDEVTILDSPETNSNIEILRRATINTKFNTRSSLIASLPTSIAFTQIASTAATPTNKKVDTTDAMVQTDRINNDFIRQSLIIATRASGDSGLPSKHHTPGTPIIPMNLKPQNQSHNNSSGRLSPKSPHSLSGVPLVNMMDLSTRDTLIPLNISAASLDTYDKPILQKQLLCEREIINSLQADKQLLVDFYENELRKLRSELADIDSHHLHKIESFTNQIKEKDQLIDDYQLKYESFQTIIQQLQKQVKSLALEKKADTSSTPTKSTNNNSPSRARKQSTSGGQSPTHSSPRRHESPTIREEPTVNEVKASPDAVPNAVTSPPVPTLPQSHSRPSSRRTSTSSTGRRRTNSPSKGRLNSYVQQHNTKAASNSKSDGKKEEEVNDLIQSATDAMKNYKQKVQLLTANNELLQEKIKKYQNSETLYEEEKERLLYKIEELEKEKLELEEKLQQLSKQVKEKGNDDRLIDLHSTSIILSEITDYDLYQSSQRPKTQNQFASLSSYAVNNNKVNGVQRGNDGVYYLKYDGNYQTPSQPFPSPESQKVPPHNFENHQPWLKTRADYFVDDDLILPNSELPQQPQSQIRPNIVINTAITDALLSIPPQNGSNNYNKEQKTQNKDEEEEVEYDINDEEFIVQNQDPPQNNQKGEINEDENDDDFFLTQDKWVKKEAIYLANLRYLSDLLQEISQSYQTMLKNISSYQQQYENDDQPLEHPHYPPSELPLKQNWFVPPSGPPNDANNNYESNGMTSLTSHTPPPMFSKTLLHHSRSKKEILQRLLESNFHFLQKQQTLLQHMRQPSPPIIFPSHSKSAPNNMNHMPYQQQFQGDEQQQYYKFLEDYYYQQQQKEHGRSQSHDNSSGGKSQSVFKRLYQGSTQSRGNGSGSGNSSPKRRMKNPSVSPFITLVRPKSAITRSTSPPSFYQHHNHSHHANLPSSSARLNEFLPEQMIEDVMRFDTPRTTNDLPTALSINIPQRPKSANHAIKSQKSSKPHRKIVGYDFPVRELIQALGRQAANNNTDS